MSRYTGPHARLVHSYGGNVTASFAVYFILATPIQRWKLGRAACALLALAVVEIFEATDGFGFMSNTYDPADYLANLAGIVLAVAVDVMTTRLSATTG